MRLVLTVIVVGVCAFGLSALPSVDVAAGSFFGGGKKTETAKAVPSISGAPIGLADVVEGLLPAVVNISSTQKMEDPHDSSDMPHFPEGSPFENFFDQFMDRRDGIAPSRPPASLGSGFIIDAEKGLVITNNHVVKDAEEVRITFHDDETLEAEVIGRDEKIDLAVLKVVTDKKLTAIKFGDSDVMRVGDWIVAIGNPFGLGGTVTTGIISARKRDIQSGPYDDYIQTDASINRGNSGGPMFNLKGEVIGINTAIFSPSGGSVGIGFAIPAALARPVIDQIIEYGHTRRGWLGVRIQSVTDEIAESLGLQEVRGALVASVTPGGPAEAAQLKAGDVVLSFDGKAVADMRALPRIVAETPIESKVAVTYWRDGAIQKTMVKIGELEKAEENGLLDDKEKAEEESDGTKVEGFGMTVSTLTPSLRNVFDISKSVKGVVVTVVRNLSEAAKKGILEGDVIVEINQQVVSQPEDALTLIEKAKANKRASVLVLINRAGDMRFVALKFAKSSEKSDP